MFLKHHHVPFFLLQFQCHHLGIWVNDTIIISLLYVVLTSSSFDYSQTGSGKTYSMGTAIDGNTGSEDQQGKIKGLNLL